MPDYASLANVARDEFSASVAEYRESLDSLRKTYNKTRDGNEPSVFESYPLVTVVCVTYPTEDNHRLEMLDTAFASIEAQAAGGFSDFEVFVVDDGSPQQSLVFDKAKEWGEHMYADYKISVGFKPLPKNTGGQGAGFNWAMAMSQGLIIAYHDDDIEWDPEFLSHMVVPLMAPGVDMAYCRWRVDLDEPVSEVCSRWATDKDGFAEIPPRVYARGAISESGPERNFIDGNYVVHSKGAAVVQCLWPTQRLWDDTVHRFNDWEFFSRWERQGMRVEFVNEVLGQPHFHGDNRTAKIDERDLITGKYAKGVEAWHVVRHSCSDLVTAITLR